MCLLALIWLSVFQFGQVTWLLWGNMQRSRKLRKDTKWSVPPNHKRSVAQIHAPIWSSTYTGIFLAWMYNISTCLNMITVIWWIPYSSYWEPQTLRNLEKRRGEHLFGGGILDRTIGTVLFYFNISSLKLHLQCRFCILHMKNVYFNVFTYSFIDTTYNVLEFRTVWAFLQLIWE